MDLNGNPMFLRQIVFQQDDGFVVTRKPAGRPKVVDQAQVCRLLDDTFGSVLPGKFARKLYDGLSTRRVTTVDRDDQRDPGVIPVICGGQRSQESL